MPKKIGQFLMEMGVLSEKQVVEIVKYAQASGVKFGEAAIRLGFLKSESPLPFPGLKARVDFFHLSPRYFPKSTQGLFPVEAMVEWGVLPLGYKRSSRFFRPTQDLNLGFLDPGNRLAAESAEKMARAHPSLSTFSSVRKYLILADEFISVLEEIYQFSEARLRSVPREKMEGTLYTYLAATHVSPS